jgi:ABC-2 type transport system ATP-binding protein
MCYKTAMPYIVSTNQQLVVRTAEHQRPAVEVTDLVKTYAQPGGGRFNAVDGVSFAVRDGEVFGFLGPNGAGKTTTLEIVEGIREPTSGRASVVGLDSVLDREEVKRRIGVQLQAAAYFDYLTLREILELFGSFYPVRRRPEELLDRVGLLDKEGAQVRHLSGGQARRFSVVAALVNEPEVVFLDEPTTGLDPAARRTVWELIEEINREEGRTVVLTTHYMEEAQLLADRIAIIDRGRIQALDTPQALIARHAGTGAIQFATEGPVAIEELQRIPSVHDAAATNPGDATDGGPYTYRLRVGDPDAVLPRLFAFSQHAGVGVRSVEVLPGTLEDVFLEITGRELRD